MDKCIFLMGPTAAGKTALAVALVQNFNCEIISVDSALVYRGMNIGTAKPSAEILAIAPHRLIDLIDPSCAYSVAQFRQEALQAINEIQQKGKIALLVGGTGLYFRSLQTGLATLPPAKAEIRAELTAKSQLIGWEALHQELACVDPAAAIRIHPNDPQRIQRALEVYYATGQPISSFYQSNSETNIPAVKLILAPSERSLLHQQIEQRFDAMLEAGLVAEVEHLYQRQDLNRFLPALRTVGYRQVWQYLAGELNYNDMRYKAIVATRQLAKRQFTWLRAETQATWFDSYNFNLATILEHLRNNYLY
jgi:tRNA dimethylallyltransferase